MFMEVGRGGGLLDTSGGFATCKAQQSKGTTHGRSSQVTSHMKLTVSQWQRK